MIIYGVECTYVATGTTYLLPGEYTAICEVQKKKEELEKKLMCQGYLLTIVTQEISN